MLAMRRRSCSSRGVRVWFGRRAERRVKRTSWGVWRREEVRVRMFSGVKGGRVNRRERREERKRMFKARFVGLERDVIGSGGEAEEAEEARLLR